VVNFINILCSHFSYKSAFLPKFFRQSQNVTSKKLSKALFYEKCAPKMLMKSSHGVNFINIIWAAFSESAHAKAARRRLLKLTPGVNFINIFCESFLYERRFGSFFSSYILAKKKHFCTKKTVKKRWWNWHLVAYSPIYVRWSWFEIQYNSMLVVTQFCRTYNHVLHSIH